MAEAIGPRQVCRMTCNGCPALKTEYWVEYPDGERDSGTTGTCTAASKCISNYWHESDRVPAWCPAGVPAAVCLHGYEHHDWRAEGSGFVCKRCSATRGVKGLDDAQQ